MKIVTESLKFYHGSNAVKARFRVMRQPETYNNWFAVEGIATYTTKPSPEQAAKSVWASLLEQLPECQGVEPKWEPYLPIEDSYGEIPPA